MYWKLVEHGVIKSIGFSDPALGTAISRDEYNEILALIRSLETEPGYSYELLDNLTWRITELEEG